jgi:hypothetical protein
VKKATKKVNNQDKENTYNLPLEEMKFIEWRSDSFDDEGYHIVTSRKTKKNWRIQKQKEKGLKKGIVHPIDETTNPRGGVSRSCFRYNLRKGATLSNINK